MELADTFLLEFDKVGIIYVDHCLKGGRVAHIVIAGAGIGGLLRRFCLHEQGFVVKIFLRRSKRSSLCSASTFMPHSSQDLH